MTTLARKFNSFHALNPNVYATLVRLAREWIQRTGSRKLGMKALFERARWEIAMSTSDPNFKLDNNYTAFYARLIMALEPDLDGVFSLRRSQADEWVAA